MTDDLELSVVIPCFDERDGLDALLARLLPVLDGIGRCEILFVDDGSRDGTAERIEELARTEPRIKLLALSRNFGHQAALCAGLDEARGRAVAMMDADLQDPPEILPAMVAKWREGSEVVYAVRKKRKEGLLKRAAYAAFYRTMRAVAAVDVPLDAGDFSLLDAKVVEALRAMPEKNRFLRGLRSWVGFRQTAVEYERPARHAGETKYSLRKLVALAVSGYVGFSAVPLRLASLLGLAAAFVGFGLTVWVLWTKIAGIPAPRGWVSTAALVVFMGGVQLLVLGVIGEYLGRVYDEVRQRPTYLVRKRAGFAKAEDREQVRAVR